MTADAPTAEVLVERRGRLGLLTLNRPAAINALNQTMVTRLTEALLAWQEDDEVATVALVGAGERGLCAGGDIVSLYADARSGDTTASARFWRDEYRLNALIARYPKPFVAVQDGIVLGGGIGVSSHASYRVVTERARLGLPETGIGFVPDVGGTWLLSRAPGEVGTRLALTAGSVRAADAIHAGLSDVLVATARIPDLLDALETEHPDPVLARLAEQPEPSPLAADAAWADEAFAHDAVPAIVAALRALDSPGATAVADAIAATSPIACAVALASLRDARHLASLEEALETEYRVSMHALVSHDFAEGVRAQVIDKDRRPAWIPASAAEVTADEVAAYFTPIEHGEPVFDRAAAVANEHLEDS